MSEQHPITPPPELVEQWRNLPEYTNGRRKMIMVTISIEKLLDIATQAARWGADQELKACYEWVVCDWTDIQSADMLRAARRPKPPSLKEQALDILQYPKDLWSEDEVNTIRRALEQLDG